MSRFSLISPAFCGNLEAIERIAREFVEDCAENGVAYAEARYRYGSIHLVTMQRGGGGSWLLESLFNVKGEEGVKMADFFAYSQLSNKSTVGNKSTETPKFLFQAIVPLK